MIADNVTGMALAALCTYLLHSTVLLSCAWLLVDRLSTLRSREWAWRAALLGGLLTTTLQLGLSLEPWGGQISLGSPTVAPSVQVAREPVLLLPHHIAVASLPAETAPQTSSESERSIPGWKPVVLGMWAIGGIIAFIGFFMALARLKLHLTQRSKVQGGALQAQFDHLASSFPIASRVQLYTSERVEAPMAHGWLQPSVTVPVAALGLPPEEQRALLAHELSHLQRRDPAWLTLARVLEIALFVQPLNRMAQRRLATLAEFQCDAAALRATGDRVALARCLTEVASWIVGQRHPLPACHMADHRSPLATRVCRILEAPSTRERTPIGTGFAATAAVLAVAYAAPRAAASTITPDAIVDTATNSYTEPHRLAQPAAVDALDLQALIASVRVERQQLSRDLQKLIDRSAGHEPSTQWLARLDKIKNLTSTMDVRIVRLQTLATRLKDRKLANR